MKIHGLLGLLISILSIGAMAEGQVLSNAASQGCPNCLSAVSFPAQPTVTSGDPFVTQPIYTQPIYNDASVVRATYAAPAAAITTAPTTVAHSGSGLAQSKAATAARTRLRGHVGGSLGTAKYEGVGWSSQSSQAAIQNCCYWGTRPVSEIGVARSGDGCWYACVLYR